MNFLQKNLTESNPSTSYIKSNNEFKALIRNKYSKTNSNSDKKDLNKKRNVC